MQSFDIMDNVRLEVLELTDHPHIILYANWALRTMHF